MYGFIKLVLESSNLSFDEKMLGRHLVFEHEVCSFYNMLAKMIFYFVLSTFSYSSFANSPNGLSIVEIQDQNGRIGRLNGFLIGDIVYTVAHSIMDEVDSTKRYRITRVLSVQDEKLVNLSFGDPIIHDEYAQETFGVRVGARMFDIAKIRILNKNLKSDFILPAVNNVSEFNSLFSFFGSNEVIHNVELLSTGPKNQTAALNGVSSFLLPIVLRASEEAGPGRLEALRPPQDASATVMFSVGKAQVKPGWSGSPVSLVMPGSDKFLVIGMLRGRSLVTLGQMFNSLPADFNPHLNDFPIEIVSVMQINNWANDSTSTCQNFLK